MRYGSRLKTETENGIFLLRCEKRFSVKTVKRYGFWIRCRIFLNPNRGNGRVRYGQGDNFGRTTVNHSNPAKIKYQNTANNTDLV